jgi:hypothetical protein
VTLNVLVHVYKTTSKSMETESVKRKILYLKIYLSEQAPSACTHLFHSFSQRRKNQTTGIPFYFFCNKAY